MPNETAELKFKFTEEGQESLSRIAADLARIHTAAEKLDKAVGALDGVGKAAKSTESSLAGMSVQLGASIGLWGKLFDAVSKAAEVVLFAGPAIASLAEAQANTAARTGLTVREVGLFEAAAEDAGLAASAYTSSMRTLSRALSENGEETSRAKKALRDLNIEVTDGFGSIRPMGELWREIAESIGAIEEPSKRARFAIDILGRSGLELLPQLNSEFGKTLDAYRAMGIGFDEVSERTALRFDTALDKMNRALANLQKNIGIGVAEFLGFGIDPKKVKPLSQAIEEANREREIVLSGGTLSLDIPKPRGAAGVSQQQLFAQQQLITQQKITEQVKQSESLAEKLGEAQRARAEAIRTVDLAAFERAQTNIRLIKDQIAGEQQHKKELQELLQAGAALRRVFEGFDRDFARAVERGSAAFSDRLSAASGRGFEGAFKLGVDGPRQREVAELAELVALQREEAILGSRANRVPGSGVADRLNTFTLEAARSQADEAARFFNLEADHRIRMVELTAGPGGELEAARKIRDLRIESAQSELDIRRANLAFVVEEAEIVNRRISETREQARGIFRAVVSGGGTGIRDFVRGIGLQQAEGVFVNASEGVLRNAGGVLGRVGEASGLGGLLKGTLFDPQNAQLPLDRNTTSLDRLTKSVNNLSGTLGGAGGVPIPGLTGVGLGAAGDLLTFGSDVTGITGRGGGIPGIGKALSNSTLRQFGSGAASLLGGAGLFGAFRKNEFASLNADGSTDIVKVDAVQGGAAKAGNVAASVAAIGLAALQIRDSIQRGGAGGALGAIGAGLGVAAAIPGPQQPFVAAGAAVAGFVGALLPDAKTAFDKSQTNLLRERIFRGPDQIERTIDAATGQRINLDTDFTGNTRVIVIRNEATVQIDALDAASLLERRHDLAGAIGKALGEDSRLGAQIQEVIFGAV